MDEKDLPDRWLAYELHDGLLQWVIGARMQVEAALSKARDINLADIGMVAENLRIAKANLSTAIVEARELIGFLEAERALPSATLRAALARFVELIAAEAERNHQQLHAQVDLDACPKLSDLVSWNLLRIAQQGLRNALQHAGPARIEIRCAINENPRELWLEISDQGHGFDPARLPPGNHFGLSSMQHRARLIGAKLQLSSSLGAGCKVICTLPLS